MPHYLFQHKVTGEIHDVTMNVNQLSRGYRGIFDTDENWERIFSVPSISTETASHYGSKDEPQITQWVDIRDF